MAKDIEKSKKSGKPEKAAKPTHKKKRGGIVKYFKDLRAEFKKVVWPSKKQVVHNTSIVLATMCAFGVFIWAFDFGLTKLFNIVFGIG